MAIARWNRSSYKPKPLPFPGADRGFSMLAAFAMQKEVPYDTVGVMLRYFQSDDQISRDVVKQLLIQTTETTIVGRPPSRMVRFAKTIKNNISVTERVVREAALVPPGSPFHRQIMEMAPNLEIELNLKQNLKQLGSGIPLWGEE
ncbi:hypothetical protein [Massilia sp. KIM]|uniref:hypothetical protein n=1 Tax=Massilia sp. KIM TaxID=1955422 RepID=UPI00117C90B3|nr:hypothetical protein [Massilia sp. KIM]